jgi:hypothetical protein
MIHTTINGIEANGFTVASGPEGQELSAYRRRFVDGEHRLARRAAIACDPIQDGCARR